MSSAVNSMILSLKAQQRLGTAPPPLVVNDCIQRFLQSKNRLLILGFNAVLAELTDTHGRRDQIKEMELKLHPDVKEPLRILCNDPNTTVLVLSGSGRNVLDNNFREYNMWLAAENGMFVRSTNREWMTAMRDHMNINWINSVKTVFEYFTEEHQDHVVTYVKLQSYGTISTPGLGIQRILGEILQSKADSTPIDYVLCLGHFLEKDEDIYRFFHPDAPLETPKSPSKPKATDTMKHICERRPGKDEDKSPERGNRKSLRSEAGSSSKCSSLKHTPDFGLLDLKKENYFSCSVGRNGTNARYLLNSSDDVADLLKEMAAPCSSQNE